MNECTGVPRAPRGAYEIAQHGDVGSVGSDSSRIHRESEEFSLFDAQSCVVELRKTIAFGRDQAIEHGSVQRPGRAAHGHSLVDDFEKLGPVSAIPHLALSSQWAGVHTIGCRKVILGSIKRNAPLLPREEERR